MLQLNYCMMFIFNNNGVLYYNQSYWGVRVSNNFVYIYNHYTFNICIMTLCIIIILSWLCNYCSFTCEVVQL